MKILVIGAGGREHALCWKLAQSPVAPALYAAPGNPGMAALAQCTPTTDYVALADWIQPDLTIVGPEAPLAEGIADRFRERKWPIIGPSASAARIESSKSFAKALMAKAGVATARHVSASNEHDGLAALKQFGIPVVLKADGLAAGKGVVIAHSDAEARGALATLFQFSSKIVIEEYLEGEEVSFIVLTDGKRVVQLEPAQDHKALYDGDKGPNTGGMGAYSDSRILSASEQVQVTESVIHPVLNAMSEVDCQFNGFMFAGLMMTRDGPKVLEFNCRLGDPEAQVLLHRLSSDLVPLLLAAALGELHTSAVEWNPDPSVCVVLAAQGYPVQTRTGDVITGLNEVSTGVAFHAGTALKDKTL
ncbi:MAG: phosphoribosylamine--glycine ligase, partial [Acidobacteriota bacterium]|nr:phosphoribosylamine--glycine ligase [Acidobacteriota bacterium]